MHVYAGITLVYSVASQWRNTVAELCNLGMEFDDDSSISFKMKLAFWLLIIAGKFNQAYELDATVVI